MQTYFDRYQRQLREKEWTWSDVPFYEAGKPLDIAPWHDLDYLDVYEKVWGRRIGCNGIGKLREVALARITENENQLYDARFSHATDPGFLEAHGFGRILDVDQCREQQKRYAEVLEGEGVVVHWIDYGDRPMGPFGPIHRQWAVHELLVINGGAVVPKMGPDPFSFGRAEFLAHWALWEQNIPTLVTITEGICEAGATAWLAQDVYVVGLSPAYTKRGLDQLLPAVRQTTDVDDLKVLTVRCQGSLYLDRRTGATAHITNLIAPLDLETVLCYPAALDTESLLWLKNNRFTLVEADIEEHVEHDVCNLKILEPGRVIMAAEAPRTIEKVRRVGVEVIEVPYSGFHRAGGGFHDSTMEIYREPGPAKFQ